MKLEQQCVSLELAKKLKELGVKQESLFYWAYVKNLKSWEIFSIHEDVSRDKNDIPTFTVAELFEKIAKADMNWQVWKNLETNQWHFTNYGNTIPCKRNENLADCCAEMLVYLLENGLIK